MTLLFYEGFDFAANSEAPNPNWIINGSWTYVAGRTNGRAVSVTDYLRHPAGLNAPSLVAGIAFYKNSADWPSGGDTNHNFLHFLDATTKQIEVRFLRGVVTGYRFQILRGATILATSADLPINVATWYFLEAKVVFHASAGSIEVRLNGAPIPGLTLSGINTISTANAYATHVGFQSGSQGGTWNCTCDDFYICTGDGPAPFNDFLGEIHVETLIPNSDVTAAWTRSTGTTNSGTLDDLPMTAADFVSSNTPGQTDEYGVSNLVTTPSIIYAVGLMMNLDKDGVGARTVRQALNSGGVIANGTVRGPEVSIRRTYSDFWIADPNTTAPWTPAAVNALQTRLEVVT